MSLQNEIIAKLGVQAKIDAKTEIRKSIDFLKSYLHKYSFIRSYILGISGGQDSSLVGRLAELAMTEMREETGENDYQFIAIRLPYGSQSDEEDARRALNFIQADCCLTINIKAAVDAQVAAIEATGLLVSDFNKGNIKARQRMISQYGVAGAKQGAVLGTDHAAENITGFFTKFGDGAADLVPIYRLNKRQGKALLRELGADPAIYEKVPTADLEDGRPGLADEVALGVSYHDLDDYLEGKKLSSQNTHKIEELWRKTAHKRHLPISIFDDFWK